jgi:hypothetical protein
MNEATIKESAAMAQVASYARKLAGAYSTAEDRDAATVALLHCALKHEAELQDLRRFQDL